MPSRWWNEHSNQLGDWCPWSGHVVTDSDTRCPAGCPSSRRMQRKDEDPAAAVNKRMSEVGDAVKSMTRVPQPGTDYPTEAQLKAALRTLIQAIPEELQGESTLNASELIYDFIEYHAQP